MTQPRRVAPLGGELGEYARRIEGQVAEVRALLEPLTAAQVSWRPRPDKWSIGEHIEHMGLSTRRYLSAVGRAASEARAEGVLGTGPFRHSLLGRLFIWGMEPPVRLRIRTFNSLLPSRSLARDAVLEGFVAAHREAVQTLAGLEGVDLGRARMRSPFVKSVRISLGQAFGVILAHNRRHLWHVRNVIGAPGFPHR